MSRRWGTALTVIGVVAAGLAFRSSLSDAVEVLGDASAGWVVVGALCLGAGRVGLAAASWTVSAATLTPVPPGEAARVWLRALPTKYLPGGLWQPLSATERLHRAGAPLGAAAAVTGTEIAASAAGGLAVGVLAVPPLAVVAVVVLLALPRLARRFLRVDVPAAVLARCTVLQAGSWVLAGLATAALLRAVGSPAVLDLAVPATAVAWLAGYVTVIAPAGLGAREAALTALLATKVPAADALAVALLSRLVWVSVDLLAAASTARLRGRRYPGPVSP